MILKYKQNPEIAALIVWDWKTSPPWEQIKWQIDAIVKSGHGYVIHELNMRSDDNGVIIAKDTAPFDKNVIKKDRKGHINLFRIKWEQH